MIAFSLNIHNPWSKRFSNLWCRSYATPFTNKYIELEVYKDTSIVSFSVQLTARRDHSGLSIELGLVGYSFNFNFYDNRHWNYEEKRWMFHTEEAGPH